MWSFLKQSPNPMFAWGRVPRYHGFCYPLNSSPTDSPLSTAFENVWLSQGKAGGGGIVQCRPVINKRPLLNKDCSRDPNIKVLKNEGLSNRRSTLVRV